MYSSKRSADVVLSDALSHRRFYPVLSEIREDTSRRKISVIRLL